MSTVTPDLSSIGASERVLTPTLDAPFMRLLDRVSPGVGQDLRSVLQPLADSGSVAGVAVTGSLVEATYSGDADSVARFITEGELSDVDILVVTHNDPDEGADIQSTKPDSARLRPSVKRISMGAYKALTRLQGTTLSSHRETSLSTKGPTSIFADTTGKLHVYPRHEAPSPRGGYNLHWSYAGVPDQPVVVSDLHSIVLKAQFVHEQDDHARELSSLQQNMRMRILDEATDHGADISFLLRCNQKTTQDDVLKMLGFA